MTNFTKLFLSLAVFAMGLSATFSGIAFADDQNGMYSHSHETASLNHVPVCGGQICAPGQLSQNPQPVVPIRGH